MFKRRYIYRERKNILATQAGIDLIATINEELLKSAKLTGIWENKLRRIERGDYSANEFIAELKEQISTIVVNVLSDNSSRRIVVEVEDAKKGGTPKRKRVEKALTTKITKLEQVVCPKCNKGYILKGKTAYGCSEYKSGCDLRLSFDEYPSELTPTRLSKQIKKNYNG